MTPKSSRPKNSLPTQKLDKDTLEWVIAKQRALAHDFRTKALAVTEKSISESMMTVAGTLHSFANALRKTVEEQDALDSGGCDEAHEGSGHPGEEAEMGGDGQLGS